MKKRSFVYGALALLLLFYAFFYARLVTVGVNENDLNRLEIGMSKWRVRTILGGWPDESLVRLKGQVHEDWFGMDGTIMLAFDESDHLVWKAWDEQRKYKKITSRLERLGLVQQVRE